MKRLEPRVSGAAESDAEVALASAKQRKINL